MGNRLAQIRDTILLVSYGGGHAAALAPVAHALRSRDLPVTMLGLTTASAYFARQGLPSLGIVDLVDHVPGYENAATVGRALAADQPRHPAVSTAETEAYLGVGFIALERSLGPEKAQQRYEKFNRQSFCPVDFFKRLFESARPRALVATNSPRSERAALEAAACADIPSLCLVDLYAAHEIEWCSQEGYAKVICVLNETVAAHFRAHGVPSERIAITGNPAFDRLGELDVMDERARCRAKLGLREDDRLLVWISQPEPKVHPFSDVTGDPTLPTSIEKHLANAFWDDPRVYMVFRLHPSEDRGVAATGSRLRYSSPLEPLDGLLCSADCVVTCSSTVGLEAAILGIPVVQITRSIFSPDLPLAKMGLARAAATDEEAVCLIREAFEAGWQQRLPTSHHPNASQRVTDQIVALLS